MLLSRAAPKEVFGFISITPDEADVDECSNRLGESLDAFADCSNEFLPVDESVKLYSGWWACNRSLEPNDRSKRLCSKSSGVDF